MMFTVQTEEDQQPPEPPGEGGEPAADGGSVLVHPTRWPPLVAAGVVFVLVLAVALVAVIALVGAFSSSSTSTTTVAPPQVEPSAKLKSVGVCLQGEGSLVSTDGLDFVAQTALGGAIKATVQDNVVTVSDGGTPRGARAIDHGYHLLSRDLPLAQLLFQHGRFVLLWQRPPTPLQRRIVDRCVR
jgi:hypothetical protein